MIPNDVGAASAFLVARMAPWWGLVNLEICRHSRGKGRSRNTPWTKPWGGAAVVSDGVAKSIPREIDL